MSFSSVLSLLHRIPKHPMQGEGDPADNKHNTYAVCFFPAVIDSGVQIMFSVLLYSTASECETIHTQKGVLVNDGSPKLYAGLIVGAHSSIDHL